MIRAILFDLDNTLLLEDEVTTRAFEKAAATASARADAPRLARSAGRAAERRWLASPSFAFADALGISAGEAMWGEFTGDGEGLAALRAFIGPYRRLVWQDALAAQGVRDAALADALVRAFIDARRASQLRDPDAVAVLEALWPRYRMALITNGAVDVQRAKIAGSGLAHYFASVTISGESGKGKPDPRIVESALEALGAPREEAVVVGDSRERDVAAARAAGVRSVLIDRDGAATSGPAPDARITSLRELPALLDAWARPPSSPQGSR